MLPNVEDQTLTVRPPHTCNTGTVVLVVFATHASKMETDQSNLWAICMTVLTAQWLFSGGSLTTRKPKKARVLISTLRSVLQRSLKPL